MTDQAQRDFSREAATWDTPPRVKVANDIAGAMRKAVTFSPAMDVLDFGCGTGLITLQLHPYVRSITGIDSAQGMLDVLQHKVAVQHLSNVHVQYADIEKGDTVQGKYHCIVTSLTLHHIAHIDRVLKIFYNILHPSGCLCIAELDPDQGMFHDSTAGIVHNGFDRAALQQQLEASGFTAVQVQTAAAVTKPCIDGTMRTFTVFLMTGIKQ
jgi:ubiquinone/menaquinone biosynthesis C-methylase UbiE